MERKQSIFFSLNDRTSGYRYRTNLRRNALGSEYLIRRLKCEHVFVGHVGCVNTVAWNDCGDILLSGSDDCKLNIYKLSSMKPVQSIQSGHQANIFSAKFLPCTADTKIASCSGDGVLNYNDVNSHVSYGKNSFRCHTGTTYEVNTTPGDPHTFMSSGEDGTVRLFDLRSKTKCSCDGCKEDVLIDCEKAVTSFSVNPVQPYYVAIGCENSLLRVYDRRSLSTGDPGKELDKQRGLLHQFKPKELENRDCRVTSLKYSSDGQNLLASYCSDYVYLFDSNPKPTDQFRSGTGVDKPDEPCPNAGNDSPMKRLRLRGDWSDTGPNARPEGEEPGTTEDNFVQRMSGYLTRWIEDSLQNARRQRRQNPNASRRHPEEDPEQSDESNTSESVEDVSTLPLSEEELQQERTETNAYSDVTENNDDVTRNSDDLNSNDVTQETDQALNMSRTVPHNINETSQTTKSTEIEHAQHACASRDSKSRDHDDVANSNSTETNIQNGTKYKNLLTTRLRKRKCSSDRLSTDDDEGRAEYCDEMTSDDSHGNGACESNHSKDKCDHELNMNPKDGRTKTQTLETNILESEEIDTGTKTPEYEIPPVINNRGLLPNRSLVFETGVLSPEIPDSETGTTESEILNSFVDESLMLNSSSQDRQRRDFENLESETLASHSKREVTDEENNVANEVSETSLSSRGKVPPENVASENLPSENIDSETETSDLEKSSISGINTRVAIPLGTNASESKIPTVDSETGSSETASGSHDGNVGDASRSEDDDTRRDAAASTIQNFFRFRVKKEFKSIPCDVPIYADVKQVFKGHRNARTMIKEANFWGDDYVLSGSDCGRIFIWSRKTAEVVMLLEGDRHVVNCVQPHPSVPILATSGIDYDIKLWTPTALNACSVENAQEVIARNERMLSENRDTLTVPASFMIRVLSSLHRVRFHGRGDNQSSGDSDSDSDEDD